jgi:hypothetical protein
MSAEVKHCRRKIRLPFQNRASIETHLGHAFDAVQEQIGKSSPEQVDLAARNLESVKDSSDAQEPRFCRRHWLRPKAVRGPENSE